MAKYAVKSTQSIEHYVVVEASSSYDAVTKFHAMSEEDIKKVDVVTDGGWDIPWEIEELDEER